MKQIFILSIVLCYSLINGQDHSPITKQSIQIITVDGNIINGKIISENDNEVSIETDFGTISILKSKIKSLKTVPVKNQSNFKTSDKLKQHSITNTSLNQEARWRTMVSSMLLGNTLYGFGLPYVLGTDNFQFITASQLLMFGGGYYASSKYTENMELPFGRWQMQSIGAGLGAASVIPLATVVGLENWFSFDENGKLTLVYIMGMVPFGAIQADKQFKKWDLSNGQASMISSSVPWGFANALGTYSLIFGNDWPNSELAYKAIIPSLYAASIGAPFLANKYFSSQTLTEDDALFNNFSIGLGFINSLHMISLLDGSNLRAGVFLMMGVTNGFGYYANSLISNIDLNKGDARIIGLGTAASFLIRSGIGILINEEFSDLSLILNMAALNAGWYYTFKKVSKHNNNNISQMKHNKKRALISVSPIIMNLSKNPVLGMQIQKTFN